MLAASFLLTVATWGALVARLVSDPANHVGIEPLLATIPFLLLVLICWIRIAGRARLRVALTLYGLASILAIVAVDRANVLVQYDRWTARGMPGRPCEGLGRHLWACGP